MCGSFHLYYWGNDKLQTKFWVLATFFYAVSTLCRSTGLLAFILPVFYTIHKIARQLFKLTKPGEKEKLGCCNRCRRFNKSVKSITLIIIATDFIFLIPMLTIAIWKPYEAFCLSRLDSYHEVPPYCYD